MTTLHSPSANLSSPKQILIVHQCYTRRTKVQEVTTDKLCEVASTGSPSRHLTNGYMRLIAENVAADFLQKIKRKAPNIVTWHDRMESVPFICATSLRKETVKSASCFVSNGIEQHRKQYLLMVNEAGHLQRRESNRNSFFLSSSLCSYNLQFTAEGPATETG